MTTQTYEEMCQKKPQGDQVFTYKGKTFSAFVCYGCQSCFSLSDEDELHQHYPHFLSPLQENL